MPKDQSSENLKRIIEIEKEVVLSKAQRTVMSQQIGEIKDDVKEIRKSVDELIDKLDGKFASKRVEWVVKGFVALVLTGVGGALISLVVMHK